MSRGQSEIVVRGAREHNLKNVDLRLPRGALTTITGVSGSGKSSLAFDTIYKEGQRRFVESLSAYARQFLGQQEKPHVDHIEGLSPTVSIDQKTVGRNPRSTVGTITEIHDHLRLLYARLGEPHCSECGDPIKAQAPEQIVDRILSGREGRAVMVLAPIVDDRKGEYRKELEELRTKGFTRARIDGEVMRLDEPISLERYERHTIEVVVDRIKIAPDKRGRVGEAVEQALGLAEGKMALLDGDAHETFSSLLACPACGVDVPEMEPRSFSFNSPHGACEACDGLGIARDVDPRKIVPDPELTLAEGAIRPSVKGGWRLKRVIRWEILEQICHALKIPTDVPWRQLSAARKKTLLHGAGDKRIEIEIHYEGKRLKYHKKEQRRYEGIIPIIRALHRRSPGKDLEAFMAPAACPACDGTRLNSTALAVTFRERSIGALSQMTVDELREFLIGITLAGNEQAIGERLLRELLVRLEFLLRVGLGYLTIDRSAATLSGGESQRIRLATQVGSQLRGILYVLDEPSIGLHQRDNKRLIETLQDLRDAGNSVLVVEHDEETIHASDHVVDIGPGAGSEGGELIAQGRPRDLKASERSITGAFLSGREKIAMPETRREAGEERLVVEGARENNLKDIAVEMPLGCFVAVTGVSGSGKSTLVDQILKRELARRFHGAEAVPGDHDRILGLEHLDKVIEIDQSPIGRTPRSNPATYTKVFGPIRDLFASLPESEIRGYTKSRFSFNVKGGRCEECSGAGVKLIEMQFLADVTVPCEVCTGHRFNPETLEIRYRGKSINDVLEMTILEAQEFFANHPSILRVLDTLVRVGLGYVKLGQPSTTLSGGEAQRVKLASQLHRPPTGKTLYLLDEPTTGLHFLDIRRLVEALQALVDHGNTVVVIEHNLDVVKCADWIVDLGPEGGAGGGRLVYGGPFDGVLKAKDSHTGRELVEYLKPRKKALKPRSGRRIVDRALAGDVTVKGARMHNLQGVEAHFPAGSLTVVTGPSGSGKTSLAFDTLFAEGQRRFVECLSTYARQFLGRMERPPVDGIEGLAPAIAIDQKNVSRNPRSTVATTTEIQDYLRLLYARVGTAHCPRCGEVIEGFPPDRAVDAILAAHDGAKGRIMAPLFVPALRHATAIKRPAQLKKIQAELREEGYLRVMIDGEEHRLDETLPALGRSRDIWLVVDRVSVKPRSRSRLLDSVAQAYGRGLGVCAFETVEGERQLFSEVPGCVGCGFFLPEELSPRMFSFNSHVGACETCHGLGVTQVCDVDKLVIDPEMPLFKGAMVDKPGDFFARGDRYFQKAIKRLGKAMKFDVAKPWKSLSKKAREAILHGSDAELKLEFHSSRSTKEQSWEMTTRWKGLCHYVEDWYRNTTSDRWRDDLEKVLAQDVCTACRGERLKPEYRAVTVAGRNLGDVAGMTVREAGAWVDSLSFEGADAKIADQVLTELRNRLGFLVAVGLDYLGLGRSSQSLSGGEAQRIRLATQIGNRLTGVIYVLDEPTIGLHQRDTDRLLGTLKELRDLGNTIVVVEHDRETIDAADWIVDLGPGAGHHGGRIVFEGARDRLDAAGSLTADYVSGRRAVPVPAERRGGDEGAIKIRGARLNSLKDLDVSIPRNKLVCVTGVSGSGKSSLIMGCLAPAAAAAISGKKKPAGLGGLSGLGPIVQSVIVDQSPIGTSPKSNPASYIGVFDAIRSIMAEAPLAKMRGYGPGRFSFNTAQGRCALCAGRGSLKIEMHFLPDVWITCEVCKGKRYNRETLAVEYRGKTVADVLDMEVSEAVEFFANHRRVKGPLQLLEDVGLGYMKLGQSATTLSGGEAQRIKLARELARRTRGEVLYVLDEPTTGLHFEDVSRLVQVLHRLVDQGHSVVVIEHNLDVIKTADEIIDLGPEGGEKGGEIVAQGTPEALARVRGSHTGRHLKAVLGGTAGPKRRRSRAREVGSAE